MDTTDWLQVLGHDQENGIGSSSPSDDMITCSRPFLQKRLRPHHDQALKCPRCDSTHTKFCYYNNYSLTQPRYFCKTCRRYWTKGGSLRNIPVGGGCRKNKKVSAKKPNDQRLTHHYPPDMSQTAETNLHLSFPNVQTSHLASLFNPSLMERNYHAMIDNPRQVDFMESKFNAMLGNSFKSHEFMGTKDGVLGSGLGDSTTLGCSTNFHGVCSSFGIPLDVGNNGVLMDTNQKFMLAFEGSEDSNQIELKPENNLLSFEWQDNGCSDAAKDSIGYLDSFGSWPPMINGHGSSPTNPLI